MTDTEIIKALECLSGINILCKECAYHKKFHYPDCRQEAAEKAIALINQQKAEIERLKEKDEIRHKVFMTKCEELETAKAEAVKEFAEKAHSLIHPEYDKLHKQLDDLLKEMVGDKNSDAVKIHN